MVNDTLAHFCDVCGRGGGIMVVVSDVVKVRGQLHFGNSTAVVRSATTNLENWHLVV